MPFAFFFLESEGFAGLKKVSEPCAGITLVKNGEVNMIHVEL